MARAKVTQANPLIMFGGQLQTIAGKLSAALTRRGFTIVDFIAWLAQQANEGAIEKIAALMASFSASLTFFAENARVKIAARGNNFTAWFSGQTLAEVPNSTLKSFYLTETMTDSQIIAKLGGEEAAETNLAEIWKLLLLQPNGEGGELLVNGDWNIFYVRDVNKVLRAVYVLWFGDGWFVCAYALGACGWFASGRIFSRNSRRVA